jgi:hypothetical protein
MPKAMPSTGNPDKRHFRESMIRKSGYRFSEKIMLKQKDGARRRLRKVITLQSLTEHVPDIARPTRMTPEAA